MRRWTRLVVLTIALAPCSGCAHGPPSSPLYRSLSPDSLVLLKEALHQVRPAFATQEEALRAGIYLPRRAIAEAAAIEPRDRLPLPERSDRAGAYVIQIAAYRDRQLAERAANDAERWFPGTAAIIETVGEVYRVGLAGWESAAAASADLPAIQHIYPGAWVRRRGVS